MTDLPHEWVDQDPAISLRQQELEFLTLLDYPAFCYHCGKQFQRYWVDFDYHADYWRQRKNGYAICLHCGQSYRGLGPQERVGALDRFELTDLVRRSHPESGPGRRLRDLGVGRSRHTIDERWMWFILKLGSYRIGPPEEANRKRDLYFAFIAPRRLARRERQLPPYVVQRAGNQEAKRKKNEGEILRGLLECEGLTDEEREVLRRLISRGR